MLQENGSSEMLSVELKNMKQGLLQGSLVHYDSFHANDRDKQCEHSVKQGWVVSVCPKNDVMNVRCSVVYFEFHK